MKIRLIIEDVISKTELERFILGMKDLPGKHDWSIECNTKTHITTDGTTVTVKAD